MDTIQCQPTGIFSWNYEFSGDNCPSASLEFATFSERATLHCPDPYEVKKEGFLGGTWSLVQSDQIMASAEKPNPFTRRFVISSDRANFEIAGAGLLTRSFDIWMDSRVIGTIVPAHAFTRRATLQCEPVVPLPCQLFAFTLAVFSWRRAARDQQ